jgi:hypothetical protein
MLKYFLSRTRTLLVGIRSDVLPSNLVSADHNETKRELVGSTESTDPFDAAHDRIRGSRLVSASFRDVKVDYKGKNLKRIAVLHDQSSAITRRDGSLPWEEMAYSFTRAESMALTPRSWYNESTYLQKIWDDSGSSGRQGSVWTC